MESQSQLIHAIRDALISQDPVSARRLLGLEGGTPPDMRLILRGLSLAAARHDDPESPAPRGLLFADAVRDLVPTYGAEFPRPLLEGAIRELSRLDVAECRPQALLLQEGDSVAVVAVTELEEALEAGRGLEDVLRVAGRLLAVIRTKESFLENLLDLSARQSDPWILIFTTAAVKSLHDLSGEPLREIVFSLLRDLSRRKIRAGRPGMRGPADLRPDWGGWFGRALGSGESLHENACHLAAGFQAQRYAEVKRGRILAGLSQTVEDRLAGMDVLPGESGPPPPDATGEGLTSIDPSDGTRLRDLLIEGDDAGAVDLLRRWWGRVEDPDPLYRWIAEAALEKGEMDALIFVNASRWGAHLMKHHGTTMVEAAAQRIAHLPRTAGG